MNDIYSRTSSNSLRSAALTQSLVSRLKERLGTDGSMIYKQQWKQKATPSGIVYWAHTASARRTSDSDCTGWPTATSRNWKDGKQQDVPINSLLGRAVWLTGWVSPTAQDHSRGSKPPRQHDTGVPLSQQVTLTAWATPNTMDVLPARSKEAMNLQFTTARPGRTAPANLREQVHPHLYPGSTAETENTGQLNPGLSRWLMGFPVEWCIAAIRATRKKQER